MERLREREGGRGKWEVVRGFCVWGEICIWCLDL